MPPRPGSDTRAMFFDLVGTLVRAKRPIGEQYAGFARRFGCSADAAALEDAFHREMRASPRARHEGGAEGGVALGERRWWAGLVRRTIERAGLGFSLGGDRFEPFFEALYHHFTTADAWELYPDAAPALDRLRARGLAVGLITNYDTRIYALLEALDLAPRLDSVTIPAVAGAAKPDRAIFTAALASLRVAAHAAVHVGDSVSEDYAGASAAGLTALLLDRTNAHGASRAIRITSLDEV